MALAFRKGEALGRTAGGGTNLATDAVLFQTHGIVAGGGLLVAVFRAVVAVIHIQLASGRHGEQGAQFGTTHTTQRYMGKAGEILVVILVRRRPPALILIVHVQVATHHVKGYHTHHAIGAHGTWIAHAVVGGADKGIDVIHGLLGADRQRA